MGFFDGVKDLPRLSLERPCAYTGSVILKHSKKRLRELITKELEGNLKDGEKEDKLWLGRLENVIIAEQTYFCSIDEAVRLGILE